jgi:phosphoglycerol transferase MdoB-like AlkP superfamily enzyme
VAAQVLSLIAALLLLDVSLTFENIWPTPAVKWTGGLSIELAIVLLALALIVRVRRRLSRTLLASLAVLWIVLAFGRYAEVTAPALYGRDVNLYWDLRFVPDVIAMVTRVAPAWLVLVSIAAVALVLTLLYLLLRAAWRRVARGMETPRERGSLEIAAAAACALCVLQLAGVVPQLFPAPVTATYARQARFVASAVRRSTPLPASPSMESDLSRIAGADVWLIFVESYGAVSYRRPEIARPLDATRAAFESAVHDTHRAVVSAFVESPTFGGSSWLAHISLLSGIEVRDPGTNARLLTEHRDTLPRAFERRGFRTVALMPGLRQTWPEGAFYGFNDIYGADRLAYRGPEFGWFAIPDQYSLERIDALEVGKPSRPPLFVFFPTISTHFPFSPTPPYQPDWRRITDPHPWDGPTIVRAYAREPDWVNFAPGYVDAISYDFATLGGYLRLRSDREFVMIVIGDHQPAAAVSGEHASWDVPVHVIASRPAVLDRLRAHGFTSGMTPASASIGHMHTLAPMLLDAFGDHRQ